MFDEDGDKPPDFLGKVVIPLHSVSVYSLVVNFQFYVQTRCFETICEQ